MNSRSLPRMSGQSMLDLDARLVLDRAARQAEAASQPAAPQNATRRRLSLGGVTWLGDMLTADKNSFGVLRLAMALLVLVSHAVFLTTGKVTLEPLYGWTGYTLGQHGVQVFFILSGILVTQSLFQSRSITDYALARGLRIFPALAVCVLLTAVVLGPLLSELPAAMYLREQWTASYIVKTLSLWTGSAELPGLFQNNPVPRAVNTSVWTLKYEVLCYVILAIIGAVLFRVAAWRQAALIVALAWVMFALAVPSGISAAAGPRNMLQVLHYFTIFFGTGVLAYAARQWIPVHAALLLPLGALFWMAIGTRFAVPAMALFLGYASIWLATFRFGPLRRITNANDYSYATYLYHYPVAQAVLHVMPGMHVVPLIGLTAGIVLPIAFLSWELIERPALALRKRFRPAHSTDQGQVDTAAAASRTAPLVQPELTQNIAVHATSQPASADIAQAPLVQPATANVQPPVDASIARVWRPMPTRRTITVMPDAPTSDANIGASVLATSAETSPFERQPARASAVSAPAAKSAHAFEPAQSSVTKPKAAPAVSSVRSQPSEPRTFSVRKPQAAEIVEQTPPAFISQSRLAMATQRRAPAAAAAPAEPAAPVEPGRAVVVVEDQSPLARRMAPPRLR